MSKQMTHLAVEGNTTIGWLTWWTIKEGEYDLPTVVMSAQNHKVPQYLQDRLTARGIESAFTAATQLGANGFFLRKTSNMYRRLVTRNAIPNENKIKAVVLEVADSASDSIEEWVTAQTVCIITLSGSRMDVEWSEEARRDPEFFRIQKVVKDMEATMYEIEGKIDDGRIRSAILAYLDKQHKVTVRGSGGVYFLPHASSQVSQNDMETELVSIRNWLKDAIGSGFSVVAIQEQGAFNKEQLQDDAIATVKDELKEIQDKLEVWAGNENMNAGSKYYSSGTQLDRIKELEEMTSAFKEALGEKVGIVEEMTNMVKARLEALRAQTQRQMDTDKAVRLERRREKRKEAKKQGTARDRNKKRSF